MSEQRDAQSRWYCGEEVPGVAYGLNDSVEVVEGPKTGEFGAVISLERLEPEPTYLIELGSGVDLMVLQRQLRLAE